MRITFSYHILTTCLVATGLLLIPLLMWFEYSEGAVWQNRLFAPDFLTETSRHTPRFTTGTFLPAAITTNRTLGPANSPVILTGTTTVEKNATLTLLPGTIVVVHEYGGLNIEGNLVAQGDATKPITFASNETHRLNQAWSGVTFASGSTGDIANAKFTAAHPGVSCLTGSRVSITNTHISDTSLGIFAASPNCSITNSRIQSRRDGIHSVGVTTPTAGITITARRHAIKQF